MIESLDYIKPLESLSEMFEQVSALIDRTMGMAEIAHEYQDVNTAEAIYRAERYLRASRTALIMATVHYKESQ